MTPGLVIYNGALQAGFDASWSYSATYNLAASPLYNGLSSVAVSAQQWGAFSVHFATPVNPANYVALK